MQNHKALISVLLVALCLGLTNAQGGNGLCYIYNKKRGQCQDCFKSKVDPTTGNCGPLVPATDECIMYTRDPVGKGKDLCAICNSANKYVNSITTKNGVQTRCVKEPNFIKDCIIAVKINGDNRCIACKGGIPAVDRGSCLPWDFVDKPIAKCEIGALDGNRAVCIHCQFPLTYDLATGKCQVVKGQVGCYVVKADAAGNQVCDRCAIDDGYTMGKDLKCKRLKNS